MDFPASRFTRRTAILWLLTFLSHPLGGLATRLVIGPVDDSASALIGGLLLGLSVGGLQAMALRTHVDAPRWVVASVIGAVLGVLAGNFVTNFESNFTKLLIESAVAGCAIAAAQAWSQEFSLGLRLAWTGAITVLWAVAWVISAAVIVDESYGYVTYGSTGAIAVAILSLPLVKKIVSAGMRIE